MVTRQEIEELVNNKLTYILYLGQSSLSEHQFKAFKKLVLDAFGEKGLGMELERLFNKSERHGTGRNTLCKEGVHHD
jgi:hypothetical protein